MINDDDDHDCDDNDNDDDDNDNDNDDNNFLETDWLVETSGGSIQRSHSCLSLDF